MQNSEIVMSFQLMRLSWMIIDIKSVIDIKRKKISIINLKHVPNRAMLVQAMESNF